VSTENVTSSSIAEHTIIGIGASAGGLEPINEFFDSMPDDSNFSFVVVQHLSPDHKSLMGELLAKHTRMKITEAEHNMVVKPNCIYLIPSRKIMTLSNGTLRLQDKERYQVPNNAIDVFFESLAKDKGKNAIGIILSGTGTDGTKGIEAIKKHGGLVIAQDPITADFDGMPASAIGTGLVDLVLAPEMMPEELVEYVKDSSSFKSLQHFTKDDEAIISDILSMIRNLTTNDFSQYKRPTIIRRLAKNMAEKGIRDLRAYTTYLNENPEELTKLSKDFLINVTKFFRDTEAFDELKTKIIPAIFANKKPHDVIKIWVVACSTGEEAYTIAMLVYEYMDNIRNHDFNIKIFATDVDKDALQIASQGLYPDTVDKDITGERLQRFFTKEGSAYRVVPSLRKMIVFAHHDITNLISCRNMLIYMNMKLQRHVLKTFLFAVNPGAYLFLGASENIGFLKDSMKELSKKWKIYKCVAKTRAMEGDQILSPVHASSVVTTSNTPKPKNAVNNLAEIFKDTLLEDHRYAGILIDENMEVKHAIGHFKDFMHFPENNLTFNLMKLVPQDLSVALGMSVRKAIHDQERSVLKNVKLQTGKIERTVNIIVKPYLQQQDYQQSFVFIILEEEQSERKRIRRSVKKDQYNDQRIEELEKELRETKENLQSVIEELESSNEELLTSNEEMISANEELQSTNEELQSLNEELHTVSAEHQQKIRELIELNDDLNNYFRNSEIGQVLIDRQLIVRKFSPSITQQINLIETDIGRPIHDITNNLKDVDLLSDIRKVMITNEGLRKEVFVGDGRTFLMKINPYLRQDRMIDGVVINFIDITEVRQLNSIIEGVFNSSTSGITAKKAIRNDKLEILDFQYIAANRTAEKILGVESGSLFGKRLKAERSLERDYFNRYLKVVETGKADNFEVFDENTHRWYEIVAVKMMDGIVTTFTDVTQKKKAADLIAQSFEDLKQTSNKLQETNNKLEQSNMDLLQFASVASHDLKEPLRKIQTFGNLLYAKIEKKLEEGEKNYLDKIINSSHRMQVLIEDVLTLSKLSNTDIPYSKTDLNVVVQRIIDDLEISIKEKGTQVQLSALPVIEAVPGQIHQLFQNLISNALKFNESEIPVVKVESRHVTSKEAIELNIDPELYTVICVQDNGIGFEDKYREKIFGIFQRLHGNNTYQGTGIGLAICKKIIDNHHGFIRAESKPGQGSTFIMTLPIAQTLSKGSRAHQIPQHVLEKVNGMNS
jgi:two-component system, chemotaxis family, CheB/CheR fusion protein